MAGKQSDQSTTSLNTTTTTTTITTSKSKMCESPLNNESADNNNINKKTDNNTASTSTSSKTDESDKETLDCPVCLQTCMHPARLPCGHVFCFLCIKGVAYKNRRCALCRREIPAEFLDNPNLVNNNLMDTVNTGGYQWYYEGRNGWWQYDERTTQEIEDSFNKGEKFCTILVAGYVYIVDFEQMSQQRQNAPGRRRLVKRDLATIQKKGVAGLRFEDPSNVELPVATTMITSTTTTTTATITTALLNTVTDTALRIASNIIDSTLAYPDVDTPSNTLIDNGNNNVTNNNNGQELINEIRQSLYTTPTGEASTSSNSNNTNRLSTSQHINSLLENAIADLETLTIQNLATEDSSDEDDFADVIIGNKIRHENEDDDDNNVANDDDDDDDDEDEDDDYHDYNDNNFGAHSSVNIKYKKL